MGAESASIELRSFATNAPLAGASDILTSVAPIPSAPAALEEHSASRRFETLDLWVRVRLISLLGNAADEIAGDLEERRRAETWSLALYYEKLLSTLVFQVFSRVVAAVKKALRFSQ